MGTQSLSLTFANLLIGLCKGAWTLRPYSVQFSRDLAYRLFGLELSFKTQQGTVAPDAVTASESRCNTLLFEWTEEPVPDQRKRSQLSRYSQVTTSDLVDVLGVPAAASGQHDVVVVVLPDGTTGFSDYLNNKELSFPLLSFGRVGDGYELRSEGCRFRASETARFFDGPIALKRIPLGYLPFAPEAVTPSTIARLALTHLISLLVKDIEVFTVAELCESFTPAWAYIGPKKQRDICGITQQLLKEVHRRSIGGGMIERADESGPVQWRFRDPQGLRRRMRAIRTALDNFAAEQEGDAYQLSFDDM